MIENELYNNLIKILKCGINNTKVDFDTDKLDIQALIKLASIHSVDAIITSVLISNGLSDDNAIKEINIFHCYISEAKNIEKESICQLFSENEISYMFMKGAVLKDLYPESYMRQMGDIDIYIYPADYKKAEKVLEDAGYIVKQTPTHHDEASNGRYSQLEIHKFLVGQSVPMFRKYYQDGWSFAKKHNGYEFSMTDEDFYVFIVAHATKHFMNGGIGIRFVVDVYVYLEKYKNKLMRDYINSELTKLGIFRFAEALENLAYYWFGDGEKDDISDELGAYILNSGTFGTQEHHEQYKQTKYIRRSNHKIITKIKFILDSLFPPYNIMTQRYKKLTKYPLLLPYYWVKRMVMFGDLKRNKNRLEVIKKMNGIEIQNKAVFFERLGL